MQYQELLQLSSFMCFDPLFRMSSYAGISDYRPKYESINPCVDPVQTSWCISVGRVGAAYTLETDLSDNINATNSYVFLTWSVLAITDAETECSSSS